MPFSDRDQQFMRYAINEAKWTCEQGNYPVGAVLSIDGKVIGKASNRLFTEEDWTSHAESLVVRAFSKDIRGAHKKGLPIELYSTWEPCFMCMGTIALNRISRLVYSCPDPYGGFAQIDQSLLPPFYKKNWPRIEQGVYREEVCDMLIAFIETKEGSGMRTMADGLRQLRKTWNS